MKPIIRQAVEAIQKAGLEVYMRNPSDSYLLFTDGTRIGYMQEEVLGGGLSISTVHKPNTKTGTGFRVTDLGPNQITRKILDEAFSFGGWAGCDFASVKKWKDLDAFRAANSFNAGYQLVAAGSPAELE